MPVPQKSKYIFISAILFIILAFLFLSLPKAVLTGQIRNREKLCYKFLTQRMINTQGAVKCKLSVQTPQGRTNSILSESAGLLMLYTLNTGSSSQFEKQYNVVKDLFLAPSGLLYWKIYIPSQKKENCNASLDDLRVAYALVLGYEKWEKKKYIELAMFLSENIKKKNVINSFLAEACCWGAEENTVNTVDLSYLDLLAIKALSHYDPFWNNVLEKSKNLLANATLSSGLFWDKYDIKNKKYFSEEKNLINNIICAIHLAQMDLPVSGIYNFLKSEWRRNHKIPGGYDPETKKQTVQYENIAVYALTLRLALLKKDIHFAKALYNKIISWQIMDKSSYFHGAFADNEAHSFDNLQVMLALSELRKN